jgi:hypothetical protein
MQTSFSHCLKYSVHPFPARMAPEIAFGSLRSLEPGSTVLDPMSGSGTVLRQANELGLAAIGFDMDPLAVLMSRVWTTPVSVSSVAAAAEHVIHEARRMRSADVDLGWIDDDPETKSFVRFWFGRKQRTQLRKISHVLMKLGKSGSGIRLSEINVLKVAFSRIIITKEPCASLARDTSHSRPHRVCDKSDYCCFDGYKRSVNLLCGRLQKAPPVGGTRVRLGDARALRLEAQSIDAILTSPPYLNAIDYMRGHRMSLVWLGYRLSDLREIRARTLGSERSPDLARANLAKSSAMMGEIGNLSSRFRGMVERYVLDVHGMMAEIARVLKPAGIATLVVGNSCLKGVYIDNAALVESAGLSAGMVSCGAWQRRLPDSSRYLPVHGSGALSKRMRMESVLTLRMG